MSIIFSAKGWTPKAAPAPRASPAFMTACLMAAVLAPSAHARAQDFYKGKTINLIVGNTAGSGYDSYARLIGRFMAQALPGKPTLVVQTMPGAGSVRAADYIYSIAPKDGLTFGTLVPGALVDPLTTDRAKYRYDPARFEYIGNANAGMRLCFSYGDSKIKTFEDARRISSIAVSTAGSIVNTWIAALTGAKFKLVTGYAGPGDIAFALERGEADVACGLDITALNSVRPDWVSSSKINVLAQVGFEPRPRFTALGVPVIWDFIAPGDRALAELLMADQAVQRPFLAPPGTPAPQLKDLRAAFDAAVADPELLALAKLSNLEINPKPADYVAAHINKLAATPQSLIGLMRKVVKAAD